MSGSESYSATTDKRQLLARVDSTAHAKSSRESTDCDSEASMHEANNSEDDGSHLIVAGYHLGNADEVLSHLKSWLIFDGQSDDPTIGTPGNLSFCMILWISLLRGATYPPSHVGSFEQLMQRVFKGMSPSEEDLALHVCDLGSHKLLGSIRETMDKFSSRQCVANIAIIDHMVSDLLEDHDVRLDTWKDNVVGRWYESRSATPGAFFTRANEFLRDEVGSIQLLACISTQSCVVFMRMSKLAAHVFFDYLDVGKRKHATTSRITGAVECSSSPVWHGFRLFISSTHRMSSLTRADVPARSALPTVRHGLECLVRLPAQIWELLGPIKTIKDILHAQTGHSRFKASTQGRAFIFLCVGELFFQFPGIRNIF